MKCKKVEKCAPLSMACYAYQNTNFYIQIWGSFSHLDVPPSIYKDKNRFKFQPMAEYNRKNRLIRHLSKVLFVQSVENKNIFLNRLKKLKVIILYSERANFQKSFITRILMAQHLS